jgi:hypothetical protein
MGQVLNSVAVLTEFGSLCKYWYVEETEKEKLKMMSRETCFFIFILVPFLCRIASRLIHQGKTNNFYTQSYFSY